MWSSENNRSAVRRQRRSPQGTYFFSPCGERANPPFNLKGWYNDNLKSDSRWADYSTPPESNANYSWILHMLSHLKPLDGVAGFLLANGALGDVKSGQKNS